MEDEGGLRIMITSKTRTGFLAGDDCHCADGCMEQQFHEYGITEAP
jgi:hypothetical protein